MAVLWAAWTAVSMAECWAVQKAACWVYVWENSLADSLVSWTAQTKAAQQAAKRDEHSAVQTWQSSAVKVGAAPSSRASAALEHATAQRQRRLVNFRGSAGFAGSVWVVGGGCWVKWVNHPRPRCCRTLRRIEFFQLPDPDFLRGLPSGIEPSLLIYSFG